jgi:CRISPR-associated Cas5-like protein
MLPDLFGGTILPGLRTTEDLVSPDEEPALIASIDAAPLASFRFQGWTGKRLTVSYGWTYDFDSARFAESEPIPEWLKPLQARAAEFAGLAPEVLAHVLLIRYDAGAGIGWHRDRPVFDKVIGVSLGAPAVMRFRRRAERGFARRSLPLPPRSAYLLSGEARQAWEHSIAPMDQTRWSVTFRTLRR